MPRPADQIVSQDRDAALPGAALARRRPRLKLVAQDLLEHHLGHTGPVRQRGKAGGRPADQRQRTCLYAAQKKRG